MRSYWGWSLGISMVVHTFLLMSLSSVSDRKDSFSKEGETKEVEMVFQKIDDEKQVEMEEDGKKNLSELKPPPYIESLALRKVMLEKRKFSSLNKLQVLERSGDERSYFGSPYSEELKRIPAYLDYYRLVREKIRDNAYHYYDGKNNGEIFLNFVVADDGHLENLYVDEESMDNKALTEIAIKSVKEAAPFPFFPPELSKFKRLQFNISIYFKKDLE